MSNVLLLRLNDHDSDPFVQPHDELENLADMAKTGADYPDVVEAATGFGRFFISADADGLAAQDVTPGATLATRDCSIQVIMAWDLEAAATYANPQTIYARGLGNAAAEYVGAGLELRVVNAALHIGEVRWIWQDLAGNLKTQIGGHFQVPETGYLLITATRRWVSSSRVVLRYFLGDTLLAEVESVDGEIGGGTTGTTSIGARFTGGAWARFLDGVVDEIRVTDEELAPEEIAMTWRRITVEQPSGYRLLHSVHDPGFPIAQDPASRAQRETRMWGNALGFASAQAENVRENILPDRAYGRVLERWESITKQPRTAADDLDRRRRRVVGKIRQKRGASVPGVGDALVDLLDTDPDNLEIIAFSPRKAYTWETLNDAWWRFDPTADFTIASDALRLLSATAISAWGSWPIGRHPVTSTHYTGIITKIDPTTIDPSCEAGIMFWDRTGGPSSRAFMLALRNDAGTYRIVTSELVDGIPQAATNHAAPGLVDVWLAIDHEGDPSTIRARWSTTGPSGWDTADVATGLAEFQWAAVYARNSDPGGGAVDVDVAFDDTMIADHGSRDAMNFYIYRDPALPGEPDFLGANAVIRGLKQAHTHAAVGPQRTALYDDDETPLDGLPFG